MIELSNEEEIYLLHAVNEFYRWRRDDEQFAYHEQDITWSLNYDRYGCAIVFTDEEINYGEELIIIPSREYDNFSDEILDDYIDEVANYEFESWKNNLKEGSPYKDYIVFDKDRYKRDLTHDELQTFCGFTEIFESWQKIFSKGEEHETNPHAPYREDSVMFHIFYN